MGFNLEEWYAHKLKGEVIVKYTGSISPDMITQTLGTIEETLNSRKVQNRTRRRVYNVFVETLQNLYHHVDKPPGDIAREETPNFGIIILSYDAPFYRISTGNFISFDKTSFLKGRIDQLNALTEEEVKTLYRDILGNHELSEKGGGGLGMLDIVRKTGNKLEYFLYPYDEEHVFFSLDVYIT